MKQFTITSDNEGQRFDKYLNRILSNGSMSFIYKMLRKKNFVLNDKKASGNEILKCGDEIKLYISDDTFDKFKSKNELKEVKVSKNTFTNQFNLQKNIIYEDNNILLINKPAGILSQKASSEDISINEYLLEYLTKNYKLSEEQILNYKPSVVNRLDRNTSGIIIAAKTLKAAQVISCGLKDRSINKYYKCVVIGEFNLSGRYIAYLTKDKNKNIVNISENMVSDDSERIETEYELIKYENGLSTVRVHLITGKSHQIRSHLKYLGFPILGDNKYGNRDVYKKYKVNKQLLHAYRIEFPEYDAEYKFAFSKKSYECEPKFRY